MNKSKRICKYLTISDNCMKKNYNDTLLLLIPSIPISDIPIQALDWIKIFTRIIDPIDI